MTTPIVTELRLPTEPTTRDPFIDGVPAGTAEPDVTPAATPRHART